LDAGGLIQGENRVVWLRESDPENGEKQMNLNHIAFVSALLFSLSGYSQTSGGTGGTGTSGTGTAPGAPNSGTRVNPPLVPGQQTIPQQPAIPAPSQIPNPPQQEQVVPQQNPQLTATNVGVTPLATDTNQLVLNTNQLGTNQFGSNLPATSQPGFTNRIMATNTPGLLTNNSRLMRDQALSETDRRLLGQIRTAVYGTTQAPGPSSGTGVYFILRDGVVRLVGFVPNAEEQKRIENIVQQVPGVVRVYDALQIGVSAIPGQNQAVPSQNPTVPTQGK